jgi:hypothetical protein
LEHPAATSLLPLARISKSFVVNYVPKTPVGNEHVNNNSSIKRATRLSPETQVTLGGYYGGHPPPPKMVPFFRKKPTRAKYDSTLASSKIQTGRGWPSGKDARARDSLRLHEDMALLSCLRPSRLLAKIELPKLKFAQAKEETKQCDKTTNTIRFHKCLKQNVCLFTWPRGPYTNIQTKRAWRPAIFRPAERQRQQRPETRTP